MEIWLPISVKIGQIGFAWYDLRSLIPDAESLIGAIAGGRCERY